MKIRKKHRNPNSIWCRGLYEGAHIVWVGVHGPRPRPGRTLSGPPCRSRFSFLLADADSQFLSESIPFAGGHEHQPISAGRVEDRPRFRILTVNLDDFPRRAGAHLEHGVTAWIDIPEIPR